MIFGHVYMIINSIDNKRYVGATMLGVDKRWQNHKYHHIRGKSILYEKMREYGIDKFDIIEIEQCREFDLSKRERYWIHKKKTLSPNGFNIAKYISPRHSNTSYMNNTIIAIRMHLEKNGIFSNFIAKKIGVSRVHFYLMLSGNRKMPDYIKKSINTLLNTNY